MANKYILLKDLEVYVLARKLSKAAYKIFQNMTWEHKKAFGFQFLEATDSIGANIAEGYHRFHYLDKIKFYYNARASLSESKDHWMDLLHERGLVDKSDFEKYVEISNALSVKLNNLIRSNYIQRQKTIT